MSGGHLNYFYSQLAEHIGDFGDRELDDLVKDLVELFHEREWYLSGDTGKGSWREARDEFKAKWFTEIGREDRIDKYLKQLAAEVFDSFGFNGHCRDCVEWTAKGDSEYYGKCNLNEHCLMHRSDYCDMFEKRGSRNETDQR